MEVIFKGHNVDFNDNGTVCDICSNCVCKCEDVDVGGLAGNVNNNNNKVEGLSLLYIKYNKT